MFEENRDVEDNVIEDNVNIPYDEDFVASPFDTNGHVCYSSDNVVSGEDMLNMDYAYHANL